MARTHLESHREEEEVRKSQRKGKRMPKAQYVVIIFILGLMKVLALRPLNPMGLPLRVMSLRNSRKERQAAASGEAAKATPKFIVGVEVPEEIRRQSVLYDMILVERISAPEQTVSGIFLPKVEDKDKKQLGKVLSVPGAYGLESEQGRVQPNLEICPSIEPGDVVFLRDAWGIGPKDQEVGERKFSFHKAAHITGVVRKK